MALDSGTQSVASAREVRLSEVIGAMSVALDLTEGQPAGHAARACAIGMRIARRLDLPAAECSSLFYALLLKDAGCSTNASKVAELYGADDRDVKRQRKTLDQHRPAELASHLLRAPAPGGNPFAKAGRMVALVRHGAEGSRGLTALRCERGADIARMVGMDEDAAQAIVALDEHWDGSGHPSGLAGEEIPLLGRILCLSQTVEVFHALAGDASYACAMARSRAGTWFDPALVDALSSFEEDDPFWNGIAEVSDTSVLLAGLEPEDHAEAADDARLDTVAEAFARIIDAKSPFTLRHSQRVAEIATDLARRLGHRGRAVSDLRRAALLHDVGKLGVSNRILDKPGKLDAAEWEAMRRHPEHTLRILERVEAFRPIAFAAASHHEKLDGSGYHLGLPGDAMPPAARILAVADIAEALSADRPYRAGLPPEEILAIMRRDVSHKLDATVFAALEEQLGAGPLTA